MLQTDKLIALEDLIQLQQEAGPPESGAPKGSGFDPFAYGPDPNKRTDPRVTARRPMFQIPPQPDYRENYPNPKMNFLMWLLSKMRGGMWGRPERPDDLQDMWLQQQQQRPSQPRTRM